MVHCRQPPTPNKVFALTFDDGPWTTASSWKPMDSTQYIFDILQRYGAKATFFEVGDVIAERQPRKVRP